MAERVYTKTEDLQPGLRLEQEIMNDIGMVLIARGTILDDYLIDAIANRGIPGVYTSEDEPEPVEVKPKDQDAFELNLLDLSWDLNLDRPPVPDAKPDVEKTISTMSVEDRARVELSEMVKERAAQSVEYMFGNTDAKDFSTATVSVVADLMRAINENNAVAVDIGVLKICDEYTFKHSVDVAAIAMIIGKQYGLGARDVYELGLAGLLHDIGKARIPKEILNKKGKLTEEEYVSMKRHSYYSYDIIRNKSEFSDRIKLAVLEHHEKLDGGGYPLKLDPPKISLYARILAVADIYDALVTDRPYKKAYPKRDAIEIIMSMTDELDIDIMRAFLKCVILYPVGSNVYLSNGEWARVVENDPNFILRPKVVSITSGKVYDLSHDVNCAHLIIQD